MNMVGSIRVASLAHVGDVDGIPAAGPRAHTGI